LNLPEPIANQLERAVRGAANVNGVGDLDGVHRVQRAFFFQYAYGALLCWLSCLAWLAAARNVGYRRWFLIVVGAMWLTELLVFAETQQRQADARLYYPRIPALVQLKQLPPGRILGLRCLPPKLNQSHGLRDIRGYDAVDPSLLLQLLDLARDRRSESPDYARTQWFVPLRREDGKNLGLPPVLDLLNVRYLIFRSQPPQDVQVLIHQDDYWIAENPRALPRAFVPQRVAQVNDRESLLAALAREDFDPRAVAYLEQPIEIPAPGKGSAEIVGETQVRIEINLEMQTPGLVVLSEMWSAGWQASLDGGAVPVLRVNSALRGVVSPAGKHVLVFTYAPPAFFSGLKAMYCALSFAAVWFALVLWRQYAKRSNG
jgi:hypothetical protein